MKNKIKKTFSKDLCMIFDFDRTLNTAIGGNSIGTFRVLRHAGMLSDEYEKKAHELAEKYYPIEHDLNYPYKKKYKEMETWVKQHLDLIIKEGLTKEVIQKVVGLNLITLRDGVVETFKIAKQKNIPIIIISAGLGDIILEILKQNKINFPNVHIVSNFFIFNKKNIVKNYKKQVVHVLNKDKIEKYFSSKISKQILNKKNFIIAGDSLDDLRVISHLPKSSNVFKVGFLNNKNDHKKEFDKNFDFVLIDGQSSFQVILEKL